LDRRIDEHVVFEFHRDACRLKGPHAVAAHTTSTSFSHKHQFEKNLGVLWPAAEELARAGIVRFP
jgi:hypothetical protein